nr:23S rRNA (guanosine(2251)-2'-O)-methyltransferase RlmB [Solimonas marina]
MIGGFHAVTAALEDAHDKPFEILLAATRNDERSKRVQALARQHGVRLRTVPRDELDLKAPELRHQGVLAYVPEKAFDAEDALYQPAEPGRWFLALDGVQDPHNLGACLRTAEAVGVAAVIIPKDRAASLTAAARAAAAGSAERVPLIAVTNLTRTLERLKELGYWTTGLAGEATDTLYDVDFTGPTVLVMGAEGEGLRRLTRETCDRLVKIPMQGKTESLNVSVATAVCLYEAYRQRRPAPRKQKR